MITATISPPKESCDCVTFGKLSGKFAPCEKNEKKKRKKKKKKNEKKTKKK